ncbi:MAG TPA: DJ-1/PfpI family protein [Ideonella sp.]|uniref:DJ-1/PfpI family protein n=1 Tax=Ideonella sp. TaxID=1929293 RepID=UPI002E378FA6|nr:DJ-1/PfpI family protein [Ideonella sp.]HEX5682422.1 DJ-1/PfpI family protein [Ideonella sp.]
MTRLLLLMFGEVELLDFAGPYEVFTTANRMASRRNIATPFELVTASPDGRPVTARAGLVLRPDCALVDAPVADVVLVPGGVVDHLLDDAPLLAELRRRSAQAQITASICTGAFVLAEAGVLHDAEATTHWEDAEDLARRYPSLRVQPERRWVDNGRIVTSAGIAAGIDMSLHLVGRLVDTELAQRTARQLDVPWGDA